jgi:hypothetical protein
LAEATFKIKWTTDLRELRKGFAEFDKLQKKDFKGRETVRKKEEKHQLAETKRTKELFKLRETHFKKQDSFLKKQLDFQQKSFRVQDTQFRKTEERSRKDKRKQDKDDKHDKHKGPGSLRTLATTGALFAGAGLMAMIMSAAQRGYESFNQVHRTLGRGIGLGGGNLFRNASRAGSGGPGGNLGFNIEERAGMEPGMARAAGFGGPGAIRSMMTAQRLGMDEGQAGDLFGAIRTSGSVAGSAQGQQKKVQKEFADIQATSIASKLPKALRPEFMGGVAQLMHQQQAMGNEVSGGGIGKLLAFMNRSGTAAFQGSRGTEALGRLDQSIKNPGGGEEGMALIQRAMGFGKAGGVGFLKSERMREEGVLGDPENFNRVMKQVKSETGGNKDEASYMLKQLGAVPSMNIGDKLQDLHNQGFDPKKLGEELEKIKKEAGSPEQQAADNMKEANTRLQYMAGKFDKSVHIGEVSAKTLDAIEDIQTEFVTFLFKYIPKLIDDIKYLVTAFKEFVNDLKVGINGIIRAVTFDKKYKLFGDVQMPEEKQKDASSRFNDRKSAYMDRALKMFGDDDEAKKAAEFLANQAAQSGSAGDEVFKFGAAQGKGGVHRPMPRELWEKVNSAKESDAKKDAAESAARVHAAHLKKIADNTEVTAEAEKKKQHKAQPTHHTPTSADPARTYHPGTHTHKVRARRDSAEQ